MYENNKETFHQQDGGILGGDSIELFMGGHVIPPFLLMVEKNYNQISTYR